MTLPPSDSTQALVRRLNAELLALGHAAWEPQNLSAEWLIILARQADAYLKEKADYVCLVVIAMQRGTSSEHQGANLDAKIMVYSHDLLGELDRRGLAL
jgi:hypothetical protein